MKTEAYRDGGAGSDEARFAAMRRLEHGDAEREEPGDVGLGMVRNSCTGYAVCLPRAAKEPWVHVGRRHLADPWHWSEYDRLQCPQRARVEIAPHRRAGARLFRQ